MPASHPRRHLAASTRRRVRRPGIGRRLTSAAGEERPFAARAALRHTDAVPLKDYHRKRDFTKTPEPAGDARSGEAPGQTSSRGGRYVVQRHRATRLHYDFRLEIDGVLVSWAVPKGPTLDSTQRRMAVHVEDHPIEYFDFEGVIPAKQYGAGDVIVWDWGTWEGEAPTLEGRKAIEGGELKFVLRGEKLRGRFTIVRTGGRRGADTGRPFEDDSEQWLLIHKRGPESTEGWDAEDFPKSVKSGRTNDEVKDNKDAIWISQAPVGEAEVDLTGAREAAMPAHIEPMLATLASSAFDDPDWLFEVKWDGFRVQAVVREGAVRLYTRSLKDAETYFGRLLSPPSWIDAREAIVDGEMVALDENGAPDFSLLQERISELRAGGKRTSGPLVYQAFDLLHLDGRSLLGVPLESRKRLLKLVLREHPRVRFASHVEASGLAFHAAAQQRGLEGIVAKLRSSRYEPGRRSSAWLKIKIRPEQELVVGGWTPGEGNARDLGALAVGVYEDGALRFSGKVGSGFTGVTRKRLLARLAPLVAERAPFDPPPERKGELRNVTWVRPELVIRAELGGWSRDGMVRQTSFKGIEEGRDPATVTRERAVDTGTAVEAAEASAVEPPAQGGPPMPKRRAVADDQHEFPWTATHDELAALDTLGKEGVWRVGGQDLKLTNLDKELFPPLDGSAEAQITKRELIRYFARIAPAMLPHLAERPINMQRFPNGANGPSFWQKDLPESTPGWLRKWLETGVEEREDRKPNTHLVADRVAALCWLGNQAAFEIHAWTARIDDPWRPTFALVDIDPGDKTTWEETVTLARLYRTAFEHLGVRGYPKLTGKRGIQAWIPVVPGRYTYADTSAWVEKVSRAVGAMVPDLVSWEWAKAGRKGRARLDYTQNASIKTLVAPYAVRPAAGAPVSAPISWDELDDPDLRPNRWTIRNVVERVAEVGDLFAGAQTDAQELPKV
jgi:bifunctional non-homologous end joining protein LigD